MGLNKKRTICLFLQGLSVDPVQKGLIKVHELKLVVTVVTRQCMFLKLKKNIWEPHCTTVPAFGERYMEISSSWTMKSRCSTLFSPLLLMNVHSSVHPPGHLLYIKGLLCCVRPEFGSVPHRVKSYSEK